MLFSLSLAQKLGKKNLVSVSLHPGVIWTNLGRDVKQDEFVEISRSRLLRLAGHTSRAMMMKLSADGVCR